MRITTNFMSKLAALSGAFVFASGTLAFAASTSENTSEFAFSMLKNCEADVTIVADANNTSCFTATSSKNLSNVVLKDANGVEYKFDGLNGHTGTFCHPSGLPITDVWVKSGCYKSGDGPGYGYHFTINNGGSGGGIDGMQTTIAQADGNELKNCEAVVSITSDANTPSCFTATSSKNLSNVVLKDVNGVEYKFDGLNGHTGTFCHPSGLPITDVWVKSGCYKSGDGPGYGYHFTIDNGGGGGGIDGMQTAIGQAGKKSNFEQLASINQFPNPAKTTTTFEFSSPNANELSLSIVNMNGQVLENVITRDVLAEQTYSVSYDVTGLENGIYFVYLTSTQGTVKKKFVVLK